MIKRYALMCLCVVSSAQAFAADVVPNNQRFPLHTTSTTSSASVSAKAYIPAYVQGGLSGSNTISGVSGKPTLSDVWMYANTSVLQQSIGIANGVAGLDENARISSQIATTTLTGTTGGNYGIFSGIGTDYGTEKPSPHLSVLRSSDDDGNAWDAPGDYIGKGIDWDHIWQLGGHRAHDYGEQMTFGWPDSGGLGATVDGVWMNGMSAGQGSGVSAGGWSTMVGNDGTNGQPYSSGYMNYDASARNTVTGSTSPHFIVSSSITDPDGNAHSITFSATGATFSPALPVEWSRQIHPGMNLMTNVIAVAHAAGNPWSNPTLGDAYFRKAYNMYGGTVKTYHMNAFQQVDSITLDTGWFVMEQTKNVGQSTKGGIPMTNTLDGSPVALDTYFTHWTVPTIEFGVYTKAFPNYELCYLQPPAATGDINAPNRRVGSLVHECDNEWDLWSDETTDYLSSMHGLTMVFTAKGKLTLDSYGIGIAGQAALPLGMRTWNLLDGAVSYQAMGNGNIMQHNIYQPEVLGSSTTSEYTAQAWQFGNGTTGNPITSSLRVTQYRDTSGLTAADTSIHIGYKYDGTPDPQSEVGASNAGQIVFNPSGYEYGVGIGAGGTFQKPNYGLIVPLTGAALAPRGLSAPFATIDGIGAATSGGNVTFTAPIAANQGVTTPYANVDGLGSKSGGAVTLTAALTAGKGVTAPYANIDGIGAATSGGNVTFTSHVIASNGLTATYALTDGIGSRSGGTVTLTSPVQARSTITDATYSLSGLPSSAPDGSHVWCSNCTLNGIAGVEAYWHSTAAEWTDSQNNNLHN